MPNLQLIQGKPSHAQLKEWFKNSDEVSLNDKDGVLHHVKSKVINQWEMMH